MAKVAIDRASIVFGKKKSGDFHSKSGYREIFIILSKIGRSPGSSVSSKVTFVIYFHSQNVFVSYRNRICSTQIFFKCLCSNKLLQKITIAYSADAQCRSQQTFWTL